jgi:hypothetical protein
MKRKGREAAWNAPSQIWLLLFYIFLSLELAYWYHPVKSLVLHICNGFNLKIVLANEAFAS